MLGKHAKDAPSGSRYNLQFAVQKNDLLAFDLAVPHRYMTPAALDAYIDDEIVCAELRLQQIEHDLDDFTDLKILKQL